MRNFGIQSSRVSLGGVSTNAAATHGSQYAPRDSNSSEPDDRELSALIFSGLVAGPFLVTAVVLFYLAS